jgi:hypothetical protein
MISKSKSVSSADEPVRRFALFGPPPLIEGEDSAAYDEILAKVSAALKPADILEDIWVRDIVDLIWEALRLRRLKASLMQAAASDGLKRVLERLDYLDFQGRSKLSADWVRRKPSAIKRVDRLLTSVDLTIDAVMAQALSDNLDHIERFERMTALAETRRSAILREINRHRATLVQAPRPIVEQIEEGVCEVVDTESHEFPVLVRPRAGSST